MLIVSMTDRRFVFLAASFRSKPSSARSRRAPATTWSWTPAAAPMSATSASIWASSCRRGRRAHDRRLPSSRRTARSAWPRRRRLHFPNGTVITPDGKTLIVGETFAHRLTAFDIAARRHALQPARLGRPRRAARPTASASTPKARSGSPIRSADSRCAHARRRRGSWSRRPPRGATPACWAATDRRTLRRHQFRQRPRHGAEARRPHRGRCGWTHRARCLEGEKVDEKGPERRFRVFDGKVAIVTGGGARARIGNGRAAAVLLARAEARCWSPTATWRSPNAPANDRSGRRSRGARCRRRHAEAECRAAGRTPRWRTVGLARLPGQQCRHRQPRQRRRGKPRRTGRVMQVNVETMFLLSQARHSGDDPNGQGGSIVNISSISALRRAVSPPTAPRKAR